MKKGLIIVVIVVVIAVVFILVNKSDKPKPAAEGGGGGGGAVTKVRPNVPESVQEEVEAEEALRKAGGEEADREMREKGRPPVE